MKTIKIVASTLGSYAGWWLGAHIGLMTAFVLSIIGTAADVYLAQLWASEYFS